MTKQKIALMVGILILATAVSLYAVIINKSAKIATFEDCEKARWLVRKMIFYDGSGPIEQECVLWNGKKFLKQKAIIPSDAPLVFGNDQIEKAVTDYLLTQNYFSWKTKENSRNFCVIENLDPESDLFPLYVWALCEEFYMKDGELKEGSGVSVPVKINYPNQLSYYDPAKFSYEVPGDGTEYGVGIKRIFPKNVQSRISTYKIEPLIQKIQKIAGDDFEK